MSKFPLNPPCPKAPLNEKPNFPIQPLLCRRGAEVKSNEYIASMFKIQASFPCSVTLLFHIPCSPSPSNNPSLLAPVRSGTSYPLELLQCSFSGVFFGCIDVLSIVPVLSRYVLTANAHSARPGSTLATAVREDIVGRGWNATGSTVL